MVVLLLGATVVMLAASWMLKAPCNRGTVDWSHDEQYSARCYNDVAVLYSWRGLDQDLMPYVAHPGARIVGDPPVAGFNEYPVLTGLLMWLEALLAASPLAFAALNAAFMAAAAILITLLLTRSGAPLWRVAAWAASPALALYAFHNWDLLAVLLATAGLLAFRKGHPAASGALLGLGACAKLYPVLFLPVLGCELLRRERGLKQSGWRFGLAAVASMLAVNLPFIAWNRFHPAPHAVHSDLWWSTYAFHLERLPTFESPWYVAFHYAKQWTSWSDVQAQARILETSPDVAGALILAGLAFAAFQVWRGRLDWMRACAGVLALALLLNKVYSLQYALWLAPFFVLVELPWAAVALFVAGDLLVFWSIWPYFMARNAGFGDAAAFHPVAVGVLLRCVALATLAAAALRSPKGGPAPVAPRATTAQRPPPSVE